MPQLDNITLFSQVFSLFITFLRFYIIIKRYFLENTTQLLKRRSHYFNTPIMINKSPLQKNGTKDTFYKIISKTENESKNYLTHTNLIMNNINEIALNSQKSQELAMQTKELWISFSFKKEEYKLNQD